MVADGDTTYAFRDACAFDTGILLCRHTATVTLSNIADKGTADFMQTYNAQLLRRGPGVAALDAPDVAKCEILDRTNSAYNHPFNWASVIPAATGNDIYIRLCFHDCLSASPAADCGNDTAHSTRH